MSELTPEQIDDLKRQLTVPDKFGSRANSLGQTEAVAIIDALDAARRERDEAKMSLATSADIHVEEMEHQRAHIAALESRLADAEGVVEALEQTAQHHQRCWGPPACSCGLSDALTRAAAWLEGMRDNHGTWLIERGQQEQQQPTLYWKRGSSQRDYQWVADVNDATRFDTKAAADAVLDSISGIKGVHSPMGHVAEHVWMEARND